MPADDVSPNPSEPNSDSAPNSPALEDTKPLASINSKQTPRPGKAALFVVLGGFGLALNLQFLLSQYATAGVAFSQSLWTTLVRQLGGTVDAAGTAASDLSLAQFSLWTVGGALLLWGVGSVLAGLISRRGNAVCLSEWGQRGWGWLLLPLLVEGVRLLASSLEIDWLMACLLTTGHFVLAVSLAGLFAEWTATALGGTRSTKWRSLFCGGTFVVLLVGTVSVFTWMNWQLFHGLLIPHGDSAMYEEHLWNVTHGKGFRSYLDQGLFLGEHIQVIHLLLLPVHYFWPSHLTLELCESLCLGLGAIPVYAMTKRHTNSSLAALCLATAWLLYFPLHFLDISTDGKTFRPMALGVPAFMQALNLIDKERLKAAFFFLLLALAAKEDFAAVIAPLGLWMMLFGAPPRPNDDEDDTSLSAVTQSVMTRVVGLMLMVSVTVYLFLAVTKIIPAFREGATVHFARYFGELGSSPGEIAKSMLTGPGAVFDRLLSLRSFQYALLMLVPIGGLAFASFSRLLVAAPLFGVLCLLQLDSSPEALEQQLIPFHHFHAPLIPILFWAAAAGAGKRVTRAERKELPAVAVGQAAIRWPVFAVCCALLTGAVYSFSPTGISFWDPGSFHYHKSRYVPGPRAKYAKVVEETIPMDARVASTDFIHTRLTHRERSYDYSDYLRRVADYEDKVPDDTDFIVIDTQHRYSKIQTADQVRELQEEPETWELLPDETDGYFLILQRKK